MVMLMRKHIPDLTALTLLPHHSAVNEIILILITSDKISKLKLLLHPYSYEENPIPRLRIDCAGKNSRFIVVPRRLVAGLAAIAVIGAVESVPAADQKPAERRTVRLPGVLVDNAS